MYMLITSIQWLYYMKYMILFVTTMCQQCIFYLYMQNFVCLYMFCNKKFKYMTFIFTFIIIFRMDKHVHDIYVQICITHT